MFATNQEVAKAIIEQLNFLAEKANQINVHPVSMPDYTNLTQTLSILSTLRDAKEMGRQIATEDQQYVACDGTWLKVFSTYEEADAFITAADETDARIHGTAIVRVYVGTDYVQTIEATRQFPATLLDKRS